MIYSVSTLCSQAGITRVRALKHLERSLRNALHSAPEAPKQGWTVHQIESSGSLFVFVRVCHVAAFLLQRVHLKGHWRDWDANPSYYNRAGCGPHGGLQCRFIGPFAFRADRI